MKAYNKIKIPEIIFGEGVVKQVVPKMQSLGVKKCLVVTDQGVKSLGFIDPILKSMEEASIEYIMYDKCLPDPPDYICMEIAELLKESKADATLAIGGGSPIDAAKAANVIAVIPEKIEDLHDYSAMGTKMKPTFRRNVLFFCVPTTSGTASEMTNSAVLTDTKRNLKYSFANVWGNPDVAIIDPLLTVGMPARLTAQTGLDAFTHACEGFVGSPRDEYSSMNRFACIDRIWRWLPIAYKDIKNVEARSQLSWASTNAQGNGGIANGHAIAHAIGAKYHMVHGDACIIVLPAVIRHHAESGADNILKLAELMGVPTTEDPITTGDWVADAIVDFYKKLGVKSLPEFFAENGITDNFETFLEKCTDATMDDFKSRLWAPTIHDNKELFDRVFKWVYEGK